MALSDADAVIGPEADTGGVETLRRDDIGAASRLSDAAGWNQTADDWALFVAHGAVFAERDGAGRVVATAVALPYGARPTSASDAPRQTPAGWVSMVLVDAAHRHRGLATRLLGRAVECLRQTGAAVLLDATPAGEAVYARAGFRAGFAFERWQGRGDGDLTRETAHDRTDGADGTVDPSDAGDGSDASDVSDATLDAVLAADAAASGIDRGVVLRDVLARRGSRCWLDGDGRAFLLSRAGRRATQLGPLVATSGREAVQLLGRALDTSAGSVFIDVPTRQPVLAAALTERGFTRQRPFRRMALGATPLLDAGASLFAVAGPEFG